MGGVPILTYHSMNVAGNDYAGNDHVALAADLAHVTRRGFRILPLHEIVARWRHDPRAFEGGRVVAITCDDGPDLDFHDITHPTAGVQRGFLGVLRDFAQREGAKQPGLHATAFVIASPEARAILDRTCMVGQGWWNDAWWPQAVASGLMGIANHSWDHNHPTLPGAIAPGVARGSFAAIDSQALADLEIRQAADYIRARAPGPSTALFAYPNGESNDYLVGEYFPRFGEGLGIEAAFTIAPGYLMPASDRWQLPRFTCGADWKSTRDLDRILDGAR